MAAPFKGRVFKPVSAYEIKGINDRKSGNEKKRGIGELDEESLVTKPEELREALQGYCKAFESIGLPVDRKRPVTPKPVKLLPVDDDDLFE